MTEELNMKLLIMNEFFKLNLLLEVSLYNVEILELLIVTEGIVASA